MGNDQDQPNTGAGDDIFSPGSEPTGDSGSDQGGQTGVGEGQSQGGDASTAQTQTQTQPQTPSLTAKEIADAIREAGLGGGSKGDGEGQPPKYTQEDFEKAFNVFRATEDMVAQMGIPEEHRAKALAVLDTLAAGINKQAVTMASYLVQQAREQIEAQLGPVRQHVIAQQEQRMKETFFNKYKELQPYESLVEAVVDQMKQNNYQVESEEKAMEDLAKRTKAILEKTGVKPGQQNNVPSNPPGGMPRLPTGGQGGAGGRPHQSRGRGTPGMEVFD